MRPGLLFMWSAARYGDRPAVVFQDRRLTYAQMDRRVNRLSHGILSLGLRPNQKVAILARNSLECAASILAIPRAGLAYIPLNVRLAPRENAEILNDAEADVLLADEELLPPLEPFLPGLPHLRRVIVIGRAGEGRIGYDDLTAGRPGEPPQVEVAYDRDLERIQYSSGTTGKPKGSVWTFAIGYNAFTNMLCNMDLPIGPGDVNLNCGPLSHAAGLMFLFYYAKGALNIILPRFDPELVLETIEREKVTSLLLVPTMLAMVLRSPRLKEFDLSSVRRIWYGTSPMPPQRLVEALKVFGPVFRQNYGMTEIPQPITFLGPEDHVLDDDPVKRRRLASAGRPALGVDLKIVDDQGAGTPTGQVGEICVRANKLLKEYWRRPEETREAFDHDGWFHTRDMGRLDEDGYLYIVDRKSDMIISGGFNIYPREVEDVIRRHPAVADAVVIGVPDDLWGEAVKALVVLKPEQRAGEAELIDFCRQSLAGYKKPRSVEFISEVPKSAYGKTDRKILKEPYWRGQDRRVH